MTNREFFNAIIAANINDEITDFAKAGIAKLDKRNSDRAAKPSKTALANEPIKEAIAQALAETPDTPASEIGIACKISTAKAAGLLRQMVEGGVVTSSEVKVPKKGKVKVYRLAQ